MKLQVNSPPPKISLDIWYVQIKQFFKLYSQSLYYNITKYYGFLGESNKILYKKKYLFFHKILGGVLYFFVCFVEPTINTSCNNIL